MATESVEDWFDEDASPGNDMEYRKLQDGIWKEGYREGLSGSKDVKLQRGFEDGFHRSTHMCQPLGELLGKLQARLRTGGASVDADRIKSFAGVISEYSNTTGKMMAGDITEAAPGKEHQIDAEVLRVQSAVEEYLRKGNMLLESLPEPSRTLEKL